jgi:hypothetical protein
MIWTTADDPVLSRWSNRVSPHSHLQQYSTNSICYQRSHGCDTESLYHLRCAVLSAVYNRKRSESKQKEAKRMDSTRKSPLNHPERSIIFSHGLFKTNFFREGESTNSTRRRTRTSTPMPKHTKRSPEESCHIARTPALEHRPARCHAPLPPATRSVNHSRRVMLDSVARWH